MPVDPVKIPQNVYIEDRIIGPLSLKQIIMITIGAGFSYALYATLMKSFGTLSMPVTVMVWIPAVVAGSFAIIKINDLTLMRICLLTLERLSKAPVRTWSPRRGISITFRTALASNTKAAPEKVQKEQTAADRKIQELSKVVDGAIAPNLLSDAAMDIHEPGATDAATDESLPMDDDAELKPEAVTVRAPVNPFRIAVDEKRKTNSMGLSDLSVFRDILPPVS